MGNRTLNPKSKGSQPMVAPIMQLKQIVNQLERQSLLTDLGSMDPREFEHVSDNEPPDTSSSVAIKPRLARRGTVMPDCSSRGCSVGPVAAENLYRTYCKSRASMREDEGYS